jgi:hypothetical protein
LPYYYFLLAAARISKQRFSSPFTSTAGFARQIAKALHLYHCAAACSSLSGASDHLQPVKLLELSNIFRVAEIANGSETALVAADAAISPAAFAEP